jgi:hypothetical protein
VEYDWRKPFYLLLFCRAEVLSYGTWGRNKPLAHVQWDG